MKVRVFEEFIGHKIKSFKNVEDRELIFELENGKKYIFYHEQDCCESVYIEDINGDLIDIVGKEILKFEERMEYKRDDDYESYTYTFYDIETLDKHIQIRWCGSSNGYYSESVYFASWEDYSKWN